MIKEEAIDYGILEEAIHRACRKDNLKDVDGEWKQKTLPAFLVMKV